MRLILSMLLVLAFSSLSYGQSFDFNKYGPLDNHLKREPESRRPLAYLRANRYDPNSLSNPYGAGNPYLNRPLYVFRQANRYLCSNKNGMRQVQIRYSLTRKKG